jgi:phytoene synthase
LRPAFDALFAIDDAMGEVVAQSTQPALGAIKLAWWRERLEELDQGKVPAEPRLQDAANELLSRGLRGGELAALEDGWLALLEQPIDAGRASNRGAILFGLAARLIADPAPDLAGPGRLYAQGSLRRRGMELAGVEQTSVQSISVRFRRLTGLAALAKRDLQHREPEGTPARAWILFRHRLTGRV